MQSMFSYENSRDIQIYRPEWEKFKNFDGCIEYMRNTLHADKIGICVVEAPTTWKHQKYFDNK